MIDVDVMTMRRDVRNWEAKLQEMLSVRKPRAKGAAE